MLCEIFDSILNAEKVSVIFFTHTGNEIMKMKNDLQDVHSLEFYMRNHLSLRYDIIIFAQPVTCDGTDLSCMFKNICYVGMIDELSGNEGDLCCWIHPENHRHERVKL